MQNRINIGLIGAGRIAGHHIRAIKKNNKFRILAICDLNIKKGENYSYKYKLNIYKHYDEMLSKEKNIDLVVILTPSGMHYPHAMDILKKYKKHLLIEKPTSLKTSQIKNLYSLASKYKKKIFPVFQNRYNKSVIKIKDLINKNKLGKIRIASLQLRWCRPQRYYDLSVWRGVYSHDGGALTNQGVHYIDLLRYLFGEINTVNAKMKTLGANIEVEDSVVANLEYVNGALGTLEVTTAARPKDYGATISIIGSKGFAQIGGLAANMIDIFTPKPSICKKFSENIPDAYGFGHFQLYRDVSLDLTNVKKFPMNKKDCYKTIQFLNSFYVSDEQNKKVKVNKVLDSKRLGRKNDKISKLYL